MGCKHYIGPLLKLEETRNLTSAGKGSVWGTASEEGGEVIALTNGCAALADVRCLQLFLLPVGFFSLAEQISVPV